VAGAERSVGGTAGGAVVRALLTGGSGFVGAAVARALLEDGWQVRALVRPSADRRNLAALELETVSGDLNDAGSLERAARDCQGLFHVAADYRLGARHPQELYQTNVEGTRHVLAAARAARVERVVYTSSVATIGIPADGTPGNETTPVALTDMVGHYKRSKFLAEQVVRDAARAGAPVVIVNPSTPVGPGDIKPTPTGQMVRDAALGRMPAYVDTGLNIVHVDDVAAGHLLALRHGREGESYILGGEDMTLRAILAEIARLVGRSPPWVRLPARALLPVALVAEGWARLSGGTTRITLEGVRLAHKRMFFSSEKATRELGYRWRPPVEAFADALRWLREQHLLGDAERR
jgi:dihydroflavonol-4-reductase